jgi:hypothetical protein
VISVPTLRKDFDIKRDSIVFRSQTISLFFTMGEALRPPAGRGRPPPSSKNDDAPLIVLVRLGRRAGDESSTTKSDDRIPRLIGNKIQSLT